MVDSSINRNCFIDETLWWYLLETASFSSVFESFRCWKLRQILFLHVTTCMNYSRSLFSTSQWVKNSSIITTQVCSIEAASKMIQLENWSSEILNFVVNLNQNHLYFFLFFQVVIEKYWFALYAEVYQANLWKEIEVVSPAPIQCLAKPYPTYSLLLFYAIRPNSSRTSAADR